MAAGDSSFLFREGIIPGPDDVVIAILGETGSGKSAFVSLCTGGGSAEVGDDLASCTQEMTTFDFMHGGRRVFLVDTPGFDDSERSDADILRTLSHWFTETYAHYNIRLSGLIYLHRINQPRMRGSALKRTALFKKLCGDNALKKVVLVTTFWDLEKQHVAEKRHDELAQNKQYWGDMINRGSEVFKHDNTKSSAEAVVDFFARQDTKVTLAIQEEMVHEGKNLNQTGAGQNVEALLAEQEARIRRDLEDIVKEMRDAARQRDLEMADMMKELKAQHSEDLDRVIKSNERLQISMQKLHEDKMAQSAEKQMSRRIPSPAPDLPLEDDRFSEIGWFPEPPERQNTKRTVHIAPGFRDAPSSKPTHVNLQTLSGHKTWVSSVAFAPDGHRLASAGGPTIKIWDAFTGQCQRKISSTHWNKINSISFASDGKSLGSASMDKTVKIWDAVSGACRLTLRGHGESVSSAVFLPYNQQLASASADSTIKIYDLVSAKCCRTLEGHKGPVASIAISPGGRQLASASFDKTVKIWEVASGKCIRTLEGHKSWVASVAYAPDGSGHQLASASCDGTVNIWNPLSGERQRSLGGHNSSVYSTEFAPDGRQLAFSPDGNTLASASNDSTVMIWETSSWQCLGTLEGHGDLINSLAFSPGGHQLASASLDETVKIWDAWTFAVV